MRTDMTKEKDWTGNSRSGMYSLGAFNRSERDREGNDFYATPYVATRRLLSKLRDLGVQLPHRISEPAVGMGHIAKVLERAGYEVSGSDIVDRGWPNTKIENFLEKKSPVDGEAIITNPPYKYSLDFVTHAMDLLENGQLCIMLLKIQFLTGVGRYDTLYRDGLKMRPKYVLIFPDRINCAKVGNFKEENDLFENLTEGMSLEEKELKFGSA